MESKHTKGKMVISPYRNVNKIHDLDVIELAIRPEWIAYVRGKDAEEMESNAERFALCWNAHDELVDFLKTVIFMHYGHKVRLPDDYIKRATILLNKLDSTPIKQDQNEQDKI